MLAMLYLNLVVNNVTTNIIDKAHRTLPTTAIILVLGWCTCLYLPVITQKQNINTHLNNNEHPQTITIGDECQWQADLLSCGKLSGLVITYYY